MTVISIREQLHQVIDTLPETYLRELWQLLQRLQLRWADKPKPTPGLMNLIANIENSPPRPHNVILPTIFWVDYPMTPLTNIPFDLEGWNEQWDLLEAEMKANSLTHEQMENLALGVATHTTRNINPQNYDHST